MGVFTLIHKDTGERLIMSTRPQDLDAYLTTRQKESGAYYIRIDNIRGHLCNAEYKKDKGTWVLTPLSN